MSSIRGSSVFGILTTSTIPNTAFSLGTDVTLLPLIPEHEDDARHSISTLVIRMYFSSQDLPTATPLWDSAAKYFWPEMYRDAFASSIGMNSILLSGTDRDKGEYSSILRQIIAYSAIDEGANDKNSRPFGDTGIRAFYDDANDLGKAIVPLANANLVNSAKFISQAFIQYAGQLALSKILLSDNPTAKDGILTYYNDSRKYLDVSFNPDIWKKAAGGNLPNLVSQKNLFDGVLGLIDSSGALSSRIQSTMASVWKNGKVSDIEHFIFATKEGGNLYTTGSLLSSGLKANFFIGSHGADNIYGTEGQDIIYGGLVGANDNFYQIKSKVA